VSSSSDELQLEVFPEKICVCRGSTREHCQSSQIQKPLSERKDFCVQKENTPEVDVSFKVVARGESCSPFSTPIIDKAKVIITLN